MNPSLRDQLKDWKKRNNVPPPKTHKKKRPPQKPQKPKFEDLSESEVKRLMGMDMPRYHRHKGALRQR